MSRRRPPRDPKQWFAEGDRAQRVGAAGLLYNAAPLPEQASSVAEALGSLASGTEEAHKIDLFTLAGDGPQDLTLTYLPSDESWNLSLNGVTALWGTDYTVSDQTVSLLTPLDARTDDEVEIQYDYLTGVPAAPNAEVGTWVFAKATAINEQPTLPAEAAAGDLAVMFLLALTSNPLTLNGWTQRSSSTITWTNQVTHYVLTKVLVGGDALPSVASGGGLSNSYVTAVNKTGSSYNSVGTPVQTPGDYTQNSGTTPAAPGGGVAVRCWAIITGGTGTLTDILPPGRGEAYTSETHSSDGGLLVAIESDTTSSTATFTGTATPAWIGHTVGVTA